MSCNTQADLQEFHLVEIPTHSHSGGEANLFVSQNKQVYLSWIEYINDSTDALQFSILENDHWSQAQTIAVGNNWFVNWADFPSVAAYHDEKTLAAHWLQKSAAGTYDYDIQIAQSKDLGSQWSTPFIPHRDSISAEHGFVTMIPTDGNRIFATWLDGRNTKIKGETSNDHGHGHGGAMSLRAAEFDIESKLYNEVELDNKVCDCCQTDAAMTKNGPIVVYRDRTDDEIRNISLVRKVGLDWTQARNISNDQWHITGCPVNGPAIAAQGSEVVVAWYTAADDRPMVQFIFSKDAGASFSDPIQIDNGHPLGRVDIVLKKDVAYLSWMEQNDEAANIMLGAVDLHDLDRIKKSILIKTLPSRRSGFPILEIVNGQLLIAWTALDGEKSRIRTAFLQ